MANNSTYRNTNILSPRVPFSKMLRCRNGDRACQLIDNLYFGEEAVTYFGILKRWTGSVWTKAKLMVYGSSFTKKVLKVYDGTWKIIDTL